MTVAVSSLRGCSGSGSTERLAILLQRDKLLKQTQTKQSDLSTARAVRGSCPDMCPEQERYIREERRRVHAYEMVPGE